MPDAPTALADLLAEPLVVIDVGCRWGFADVWRAFGDRCMLIGFDPDVEECERLNRQFGGTSARFVPSGLGGRNGLATLHLTRDPGGHSLYPPAEDAVGKHPGLAGGVQEQTIVVDLITLDDWRRAEGVTVIDVIKLDTQGSELDILQGAEETLSTVRAIEVEVQFNELYEGVPVFADVDHYLRGQGFRLWRLRNLSHYAHVGADREWHVADTQHFDDFTATFPTGAGQLYWANAFYVRDEVARPDLRSDWRSLVRDACVTYAFGFFDLSGLAIAAATRVAPPEAEESLAAATSGQVLEKRRASELARQARTLERTLIVDLGAVHLQGGGWGPALVTDHGALRWTGPGRDAWIDIPVILPAGTRIEVAVAASMSSQILASARLAVNRVDVVLSPSPMGRGVLLSGVLAQPAAGKRGFTRVMLRLDHVVPWSQLNPDSDDDSEMGVAVTTFRFTPPGPA